MKRITPGMTLWAGLVAGALLWLNSACYAQQNPHPQLTAPFSKLSDASPHTQASGTGTAGAVTATLSAVAGKWGYLSSATIGCFGGVATAGATFTITGLQGGTISVSVPAVGIAVLGPNLALQTTAENTAIACSGTAPASTTCSCTLVGSAE